MSEISVFPTGILVSGLKILPYEHFIPVTERKIIQCIFVIERTLPSFTLFSLIMKLRIVSFDSCHKVKRNLRLL